MPKFVSYLRVSTQRQGQSGLGLSAQREAVTRYLAGLKAGSELISEFVEVETAKHSNALERRPQLRDALELCRKERATLLIAKLDRLARNVHFVSGLIESNVSFVAVDMPQANKVMLQMHAVMAEWERDQISARVKAALAQAKLRGVVLGSAGPRNLRSNTEARRQAANEHAKRLEHVLRDMSARGLSVIEQAQELNRLGIRAPKGGEYGATQVRRIRARLDGLNAGAEA
jgi:DNA invertase Pin-like site-specific DNA recombinase